MRIDAVFRRWFPSDMSGFSFPLTCFPSPLTCFLAYLFPFPVKTRGRLPPCLTSHSDRFFRNAFSFRQAEQDGSAWSFSPAFSFRCPFSAPTGSRRTPMPSTGRQPSRMSASAPSRQTRPSDPARQEAPPPGLRAAGKGSRYRIERECDTDNMPTDTPSFHTFLHYDDIHDRSPFPCRIPAPFL